MKKKCYVVQKIHSFECCGMQGEEKHAVAVFMSNEEAADYAYKANEEYGRYGNSEWYEVEEAEMYSEEVEE